MTLKDLFDFAKGASKESRPLEDSRPRGREEGLTLIYP